MLDVEPTNLAPADVEAVVVVASAAQPRLLHGELFELDDLRPSPTAAQALRRAQYSQDALKELSESIRVDGQIQAILIRPIKGATAKPRFEIVVGERRWLASGLAKLTHIRCEVQDLADAQALKLQLTENLKREELSALAEAQGYDEYIRVHGRAIKDVAAEFDKKPAYVAKRLVLLALCSKAREAFEKGKFHVGHAELIARIPVQSLQEEALKGILDQRYGGEPMPYGEAQRYIHRHFMLDLKEAPFDTGDAALVPEAGACGACPKRTGNQHQLFGDVKSREVCTDRQCFELKRTAMVARRLEQAKAIGQTIIEGAAAKKIVPFGAHHLEGGHVRPDDRCDQDPKSRTYRQILGKSAPPPALVKHEDSGSLIEIYSREAITPLLKEKGVQATVRSASRSPEEKARMDRAKWEGVFRLQLFEGVRAKHPGKLAREHLLRVAECLYRALGHDNQKRLVRTWKWELPKGAHPGQIISGGKNAISALSEADLARFLLDCTLVSDLYVSGWSESKPMRLLETAKAYKVDSQAVRKAVDRERKAQQKPKPRRGSKATRAPKARAAASRAARPGSRKSRGKKTRAA